MANEIRRVERIHQQQGSQLVEDPWTSPLVFEHMFD
jgi:hypothetical protein